jgi:hypothetical protein
MHLPHDMEGILDIEFREFVTIWDNVVVKYANQIHEKT